MEHVPQLVKTLRYRYARSLGQLAANEGDPGALMSDICHLRAVMLMYRPGEDFTAIKPVRPKLNRRGGRGRGAVWLIAAMDMLRTAEEPLTAQEITQRVLEARGEAMDGSPAAVSAECSLLATLRKRRGQDFVRYGEHRPYRWALKL